MDIKILFDNKALSGRYANGWGASYLIDNSVLFDTGEDPMKLLRNMKNMGTTPEDIKAVVISHEHWDHTGGLWRILKERPFIKVYICPNFSRAFKEKIRDSKGLAVEVGSFTELYKGIYSTGEIEGQYKAKPLQEQSLIIKTEKGITVITGCAHPGIVNIVSNAKKNMKGRINMVLGGFHLKDKTKETIKDIAEIFKQEKVSSVAAAHCTGREAKKVFSDLYKKNYFEIKTGQCIIVQ